MTFLYGAWYSVVLLRPKIKVKLPPQRANFNNLAICCSLMKNYGVLELSHQVEFVFFATRQGAKINTKTIFVEGEHTVGVNILITVFAGD